MSTVDVIAIISGIINIILVVCVYRAGGRRNEYDFIDNQIADILKIQMTHPSYRRDDHLAELEEGSLDALRYEAYCCLVWNSLETMYEKYGERRLENSTFFPAMQALARRHKPWMDKIQGAGYARKMRRFLLE